MFTRRSFLSTSIASATALQLTAAKAQLGNAGRICVGFPPGGAADIVSRLVGTKLTAKGLSYVVDNRAGAGGRLAVDNVKSSLADGQTMLVTPDAIMVIYPHVYKKLSYDPIRDFRAVTTLATVPIGILVGPMVPSAVKTMGDFAQWCKSHPQLASYGTSGAGTSLHFIGAMFARASGFELTHVPYRGANLAAQDVAGGQLASCINVLGDVLPLIQAGKLRVLAVSTPSRSRFLPEVPTFRESGFKELETQTWYGLFVPARTPEARVTEIHAAVVDAFKQPDVAETLSKFGMEPRTSTSTQFAALLKADIDHWGPVVKQTGYSIDE